MGGRGGASGRNGKSSVGKMTEQELVSKINEEFQIKDNKGIGRVTLWEKGYNSRLYFPANSKKQLGFIDLMTGEASSLTGSKIDLRKLEQIKTNSFVKKLITLKQSKEILESRDFG